MVDRVKHLLGRCGAVPLCVGVVLTDWCLSLSVRQTACTPLGTVVDYELIDRLRLAFSAAHGNLQASRVYMKFWRQGLAVRWNNSGCGMRGLFICSLEGIAGSWVYEMEKCKMDQGRTWPEDVDILVDLTIFELTSLSMLRVIGIFAR